MAIQRDYNIHVYFWIIHYADFRLGVPSGTDVNSHICSGTLVGSDPVYICSGAESSFLAGAGRTCHVESEILFIVPFFIFLNLPSNFSLFQFSLILFLGTGAIVSVGCLISGITLQAGLRDVLIPILLFPSASPVAIAATKCTESLFDQKPMTEWNFWFFILGSFFVIFSLFGYMVFNRIVEE